MVPYFNRNDPAQPLLSLVHYKKELDNTTKELATVRTQFEAKILDDTKLTNKILGGGEGPDDDAKGLRQRLLDERTKAVRPAGRGTAGAAVGDQRRGRVGVDPAPSGRLRKSLRRLNDYLRQRHGVPTRPDDDM